MTGSESFLSLMDLLDIDENAVDKRLESIMSRSSFTSQHLHRTALLLQYKLLLNVYEETDLDNNAEVDFAVRLLSLELEECVEHVCKVVHTSLLLNKNTLETKAQHILQQIFCDLDLHSIAKINSVDKNKFTFKLKVMDCVLEAAVASKMKIFLLFNDTPIENSIYSEEPDVRNHFLTKTVVNLVEAVEGMSILDRIWNSISACDITHQNKALITLCSLAEYYLPIPDENGIVRFESAIILKREFWMMVLQAFQSPDSFNRRCSLYLAKRAIDCAARGRKDIEVLTRNDQGPLFSWNVKKSDTLDTAWKSYFLLLETLEEKQSNIVHAGLALFREISPLSRHWRNCAFDLALKHPNLSVVQQGIEYRLSDGLTNIDEAKTLLEALNNIHMFDDSSASQKLMISLREFCLDVSQFKYIFQAIPEIKWLPVPLFQWTEIFSSLKLEKLEDVIGNQKLVDVLCQILQKACNNLVIAEAICSNIVYFFIGNCGHIDIVNFVEIIGKVQFNFAKSTKELSPFIKAMSQFLKNYSKAKEELSADVWNIISKENSTMDILLMYLSCHPNEISKYLASVEERIAKIKDLNDRPYAVKGDCEKDLLYLCTLVEKIGSYKDIIQVDTLLYPIKDNVDSLLSYTINLTMEDDLKINQIFYNKFSPLITLSTLCPREKLSIEFYKYSVGGLEDLKCLKLMRSITSEDDDFSPNILCKMILCSRITTLLSENRIEDNEIQGHAEIGRLRNQLNELCCQLIIEMIALNKHENELPLQEISEFLYEIIDTSGNECLMLVLKIYNLILPQICKQLIKTELAPAIFMARAWKELKELRSNALCKPSTKEFVSILMNKCLLRETVYNECVHHYCTEILEYGYVSNVPLYYLTDKMEGMMNACQHEPLLATLSDILLFGRAACKDHRITDAAVKHIKDNSSKYFSVDISKGLGKQWNVLPAEVFPQRYSLKSFKRSVKMHLSAGMVLKAPVDYYFDSEIRSKAIKILLQPSTGVVAAVINSNNLVKVSTVFRNKTRYHSNSQPHRLLFRSLQHTLLMSVVYPHEIDLDKSIAIYIDLLEKLPHQLSVRICMEVLIAFVIITKNYKLNNTTFDTLRLKAIPPTSLFMIVYLVMLYKLKNNTESIDTEYAFAMDYLLSHTMGQIFNVRLNAQYFATRIYTVANENLSAKYKEIIKVIEHTFEESKAEKTLIKLQNCYFANKFDVLENLTPQCIYNFIPTYTQMDRDEIMKSEDIPTIEDCEKCINSSRNINKEMCMIWMNSAKSEPRWDELKSYTRDVKQTEIVDVSTIQKKYIPWSHMFHGEEACMVNAQKNVKKSGLIVVASLVDKLPNLGGLARTSEVFAVKKYVIDNLKHLEDKNFQGLSVSAEKWVDIEQVRAGHQLKEYLQRMKCEGYTVIAAEQTSSSVPLQTFSFPHNTLLLLGHEKEGVPCDLLPFMDQCVEIPQRGCVRSLNVHVTAAIFVWEYVRQNLL